LIRNQPTGTRVWIDSKIQKCVGRNFGLLAPFDSAALVPADIAAKPLKKVTILHGIDVYAASPSI